MSRFWVPSTKRELVQWLVGQNKGTSASLNKMPKKQLYAIYFRARQGD